MSFRAFAEQRIIAAFSNAAARVPAYRKLLGAHGIDPESIHTFEDFTALVPLTNKDVLFGSCEIPDLCLDGSIGDASAAYTSSGYSGTFSFGLESPAEADRLRSRIDMMLGLHFGAPQVRTLLINALPMGVRVPASVALVIDTGTRSDAVLASVRKLGGSFDQIVIIAEHPLLKKIAEEGAQQNVDWKSRRVNLVTGAEVMPENFRAYVGRLLGHTDDESRGKIVVSVGVSEVGLSVGQEMPFCRRLRKAAHNDVDLRERVFGVREFIPTLAQWSPEDYWVETIPDPDGRSRLVITTLDTERKIPLIRYATGDWAHVIDPAEMHDALTATGVNLGAPEFTLPFIAMFGRGRALQAAARPIYPEQIKEAIYTANHVAALTGNFRLQHPQSPAIEFQLRPGIADPMNAVRDELGAILTRALGAQFNITTLPFSDFWDDAASAYQRKFRYL